MTEELQQAEPEEVTANDAQSKETDRAGALEKVVAEKEAEIARLMQTKEDLEQRVKALNDSLSKAVTSYRTAVVRANPEVIEELVAGDTIETIDEALARGKDLVSKVRQGVEAAISQTRIPAGAPERTPPDLSALSPREKIQYAMGRK